MKVSSHSLTLWVTSLLPLCWLPQRVLLLETTCGTICKEKAAEFSLPHSDFYSLSLDCNIPTVTATFNTKSNFYFYSISELYLECNYRSRNSSCTPILENVWDWPWRVNHNYHDTADLNTSFLQECKLMGCFNYQGTINHFAIAPSICNISGVTVEFEQTHDVITEGENTSLCVRLQGQSGIPVDVSIRIINSTSTFQEKQDYLVGEKMLSFPARSTENHQCIEIHVFEDKEIENNEEIIFDLEIVRNTETIMLGPNKITKITIIDNDVEVMLEHLEYSVNEGEGQVEVCINIHGHKEFNITFTTHGHPGINQDYAGVTNLTGSVNKGENFCLLINITDDSLIEDTEEFEISIFSSDPSVTIAQDNASATIFIIDDDRAIIGFDEKLKEVSEQGIFNACFTLEGQLEKSIDVSLLTMSNTAKSGTDYIPANSTLTFHPSANENQTNCINISVIEDSIYEEDEEFQLVLSSQDDSVVVTISEMVIVILNNDTVNISLSDLSKEVNETNETINICLQLSSAIGKNISYRLKIKPLQPLQTSSDADFSSTLITSGFPVSLETNQTRCHSITIIEDNIVEEDEEFIVILEDILGIIMDVRNTTITIKDSDQVKVGFTKEEFLIENGIAHYCINRSGNIARPVSVDVSMEQESMGNLIFLSTIVFEPNGTDTNCPHLSLLSNYPQRPNYFLVLTSSDRAVQISVHTAKLETILEHHYNHTMLYGFSQTEFALCGIFSAMIVLIILSVILVTWHWCSKRSSMHPKHYDLSEPTQDSSYDENILFRPPSRIPPSYSCLTSLDTFSGCHSEDNCKPSMDTLNINTKDLRGGSCEQSDHHNSREQLGLRNGVDQKESVCVDTSDGVESDLPLKTVDQIPVDIKIKEETNYLSVAGRFHCSTFPTLNHSDRISLDADLIELPICTAVDDHSGYPFLANSDTAKVSNGMNINSLLKSSKSFDDTTLLKYSTQGGSKMLLRASLLSVSEEPCNKIKATDSCMNLQISEVCDCGLEELDSDDQLDQVGDQYLEEICNDFTSPSLNLDELRDQSSGTSRSTSNDAYLACSDLSFNYSTSERAQDHQLDIEEINSTSTILDTEMDLDMFPARMSISSDYV